MRHFVGSIMSTTCTDDTLKAAAAVQTRLTDDLDLPDRYLALNESYSSPFAFKLTQRGFYSEVNNLLNAVLFGLVKRRRLIVDQSGFEGQRWTDFFMADLPTAPPSLTSTISKEWVVDGVTHPGFHIIRKWAMRRHQRFPLLWLPEIGVGGSVFRVKRFLARMLTTPRLTHDVPSGLRRPFAAFHIRRGDKVGGYVANGEFIQEGDDVAPSAYVAFLNRVAPEIRCIFVMTDDYRCVEEVRTASPWRMVQSFCPPADRGYQQTEFSGMDAEQKRNRLKRLIAETEISSASDLFVGGFKSNVARFITLSHYQPARCFSIDGKKRWSPE
jgi:hypothetical protein